MNNSMRSFSNAFLIVTVLLSVAVMLGLHPNPATGLVVLVLTVGFLDLPHGALDPLVVQSAFPGSRKAIFYLLYLFTSALVVLAWITGPKVALGCFLLIAAFHFGSALEGESRVWLRTCYGVTIITLPCILHSHDVATMYRMLALQSTGDYVAVSHWIAYVAGAATLIAVSWKVQTQPRRVAEVAVILLAGICLPPLLFFSCYFGLLHIPRHLIETASSLGLKTAQSLFTMTAPIFVSTLYLAAIGWRVPFRVPVAPRWRRQWRRRQRPRSTLPLRSPECLRRALVVWFWNLRQSCDKVAEGRWRSMIEMIGGRNRDRTDDLFHAME